MRHVTCRGVDWMVKDPVVTGAPSWHFWDDWERGDFEPATLDIVERFVTPGSTVIDCGAWCGPISLWASHCGARVVAVEPDPVAVSCLYRNVEANNARVEIFEGALSDHTGICHIQSHPDGWGSSMTRVADEGTEVACLTMQDLFDIYDVENCVLVKIDCEGAEALILESAAPFLADLGIPLLVAMHQPWWPRPVERSWFDGYTSVEGNIGGWDAVLALP